MLVPKHSQSVCNNGYTIKRRFYRRSLQNQIYVSKDYQPFILLKRHTLSLRDVDAFQHSFATRTTSQLMLIIAPFPKTLSSPLLQAISDVSHVIIFTTSAVGLPIADKLLLSALQVFTGLESNTNLHILCVHLLVTRDAGVKNDPQLPL